MFDFESLFIPSKDLIELFREVIAKAAGGITYSYPVDFLPPLRFDVADSDFDGSTSSVFFSFCSSTSVPVNQPYPYKL